MERNLYTYTYLHLPWEDVRDSLDDDPVGLLQDATSVAGEHADTAVAHLRVDVGSFEVARDAVVEVGELGVVDSHCVALPIRWRANRAAGLFPAMEGLIEAAQLSSRPPTTQLSFIGHYTPPLGVVGAMADAGIGRRVAEVAVHHFLMDVAARLERRLATSPVGN